MVEYRWFAVGILMMYVIVSEILVLPVIWPPSWYTWMSYDIGSTTTKKRDPENVEVAV